MKISYNLLLFFFLLYAIGSSQVIQPYVKRIPVQYPTYLAYVEVYEHKTDPKKLDNTKFYYWIKAKKIHSSKGGYEGELLHGDYTALYTNDALKEKGRFNKGLKTGEWKEWYPNGELMKITRYTRGLLNGTSKTYNERGKLTVSETYKDGKLHGKQIFYLDSTRVIKTFKNGIERKKKLKAKPFFRKQTDHKKSDTIETETNKTEINKKKRSILKRQNKDQNNSKEKPIQEPKTKKTKDKISKV